MGDVTRTVVIWVAFGVAGIVFAVGIGIAAAEISSERIGLSSEPLSAGEDLAPDPLGSGGRRGATTRAAPPTEEEIKAGEETAEEAQEVAEEAQEEAQDATEDALEHDESDEDD